MRPNSFGLYCVDALFGGGILKKTLGTLTFLGFFLSLCWGLPRYGRLGADLSKYCSAHYTAALSTVLVFIFALFLPDGC